VIGLCVPCNNSVQVMTAIMWLSIVFVSWSHITPVYAAAPVINSLLLLPSAAV